ncbi:transposase, partial [Bacillus paranthracis]|nr:transposase [Bacillus paranthracis]
MLFLLLEIIQLLEQSSYEYIKVIHTLVSEMAEANLPSAVKNQAIKDAKSVFSTKVKKRKYKVIPILKRPVCVWNNQNDSFDFTHISVPLMVNGKSTRLKVRALLTDKYNRNFNLLKHKLGTLRITKKSNKWIAQI